MHLPTALVLLLAAVGAASAQEVHVLSNSNFEKNTQASTGSTTGNFFVKFYAPWCGHCKAMKTPYMELVDHFEGNLTIVIAEIDATAHKIPSNYAAEQ